MIGWYLMARSKVLAETGAPNWKHWRPSRLCQCNACNAYYHLLIVSSPLNGN